jgi:hypothetical protein
MNGSRSVTSILSRRRPAYQIDPPRQSQGIPQSGDAVNPRIARNDVLESDRAGQIPKPGARRDDDRRARTLGGARDCGSLPPARRSPCGDSHPRWLPTQPGLFSSFYRRIAGGSEEVGSQINRIRYRSLSRLFPPSARILVRHGRPGFPRLFVPFLRAPNTS